MGFVTVTQLQRDYGLSYAGAAMIILEQTTLVRRRCRRLYALLGLVLAVTVACTFAPRGSLGYRIDGLLFALSCLGIGGLEIMIRHKAQAAILAIARGAARTG